MHTSSGQSLFEIHVERARLTQEAVVSAGVPAPRLFAAWTFFDHQPQYTPVCPGPEARFDSSAYYRVRLDDPTLDFLAGQQVRCVPRS